MALDLEIAAADSRLTVALQTVNATHMRHARLVARDDGHIIELPDVPTGVEYHLVLRNACMRQDADARVVIDGVAMGRFRVPARSMIPLRRPADTAGFGDRAFTFFPTRCAGAIEIEWHLQESAVATLTRHSAWTRPFGEWSSDEEEALPHYEMKRYTAAARSELDRCMRSAVEAMATSAGAGAGAGAGAAAGGSICGSGTLRRAGERMVGVAGAASAKTEGATVLGHATGQVFMAITPLALGITLPPMKVAFRLVTAKPVESEHVTINTDGTAIPPGAAAPLLLFAGRPTMSMA